MDTNDTSKVLEDIKVRLDDLQLGTRIVIQKTSSGFRTWVDLFNYKETKERI